MHQVFTMYASVYMCRVHVCTCVFICVNEMVEEEIEGMLY